MYPSSITYGFVAAVYLYCWSCVYMNCLGSRIILTMQVSVSCLSIFKYCLIGSVTLDSSAVLGSTYLNTSIVFRYVCRIFSVDYTTSNNLQLICEMVYSTKWSC